ncbi:ABC-transporter ATP-binding protein [Pectobacterium atrosepticum SCRI1043]|uniref:ABC-transporter ATP-binding protein n=1 Tax=Pectobacterium atrosepticum (strain SCRI 1043 / ATCC BAA-672) TaxID=218491 RepID=Q6D2X4_PECAS|nr:amino acid ABC transporter ATP-binding protein [Pectobacterium atrosepticum]AIK14759.1 ABC-transporter ATP-binding protein [Pectobacterium atrosepticum]MCL6315052.1 amino acid ABC transporter ATP-binding protein [Pectobacterium atrosepticum]MCL6320712.1 amino acid ABC transporter ATP-binding protein [Pectobacterium atrosepticum]POW31350.1 arginine ABC transporter ATP-binding protein [Pectobacterium atrosepticum]CAG75870.1 ABC-transporter ATP-binding protein [Pectobacterium atrosepticum SCRI
MREDIALSEERVLSENRDLSEDTVLRIRGLQKRFGAVEVLKGIDLDVRRGEKIAIIGGSGSGKSTLLRCLNFMEIPSAGTIELDGVVLGKTDAKGQHDYPEKQLCAVRERVGMVFQQFNLFPHLTVLENVREALVSVKKMPRHEADIIAKAQLEKVGLSNKQDARPSSLSGGQQQRVAIARALAMSPEVMLFDEPTSSLDPELVGEVLHTIRALADEGRTLLLVTHELGFAYHFADRVVFIENGVIHEMGSAEQVLKNPQQPRTQAFLARFAERAF